MGYGRHRARKQRNTSSLRILPIKELFVWLLAHGTESEIRSLLIFEGLALLKKPQPWFKKNSLTVWDLLVKHSLGPKLLRKRIRVQKLFNPPKKPRCVTPTSDVAKEKSENGWRPCQIARYNECINLTAIYSLNYKKALFTSKMSTWWRKKKTVRSPWTL